MTTREPGRHKAIESDAELALDPETVKDLEPRADGPAKIRGGNRGTTTINAQSDARLKEGVETLDGSLARLRALNLG